MLRDSANACSNTANKLVTSCCFCRMIGLVNQPNCLVGSQTPNMESSGRNLQWNEPHPKWPLLFKSRHCCALLSLFSSSLSLHWFDLLFPPVPEFHFHSLPMCTALTLSSLPSSIPAFFYPDTSMLLCSQTTLSFQFVFLLFSRHCTACPWFDSLFACFSTLSQFFCIKICHRDVFIGISHRIFFFCRKWGKDSWKQKYRTIKTSKRLTLLSRIKNIFFFWGAYVVVRGNVSLANKAGFIPWFWRLMFMCKWCVIHSWILVLLSCSH